MAMKLNVKKGTATALLATSVAFSPLMAGSAFAHGAPEATGSSEGGGAGVAVMNQGEQGQDVVNMQKQLQKHGYDVSTDGIYGSNVESKVVAFQNDQGWDADGVVDTPTLNALGGSAAAVENNTSNETNAGSAETDNTAADQSSNAQPAAYEVATEDQQVKSETVQSTNGGAVSTARSLVGSPYVSGGTTPAGFDSSGFINYVFQQQGVNLSRTHAGMWSNNGTQVSNPQPGDVVFFAGTYKDGVSHSGIYLGNHKMIHAGTENTGVEVTTQESWDYYWADKYIGAKRF